MSVLSIHEYVSNLQKPAASSSLHVPVQEFLFILWNDMLILLEMRCVHERVCAPPMLRMHARH